MYKTIVVTDQAETPSLDLNVITFDQYLADYPKLGEPRTRIINLCDTEHYLSRGYYCSLLAESRQHRVLPSVNTINDLRYQDDMDERHQPLRPLLPKIVGSLDVPVELDIFFGWVPDEEWRKVARSLFERYASPLLKATLSRGENGVEIQVERGNLSGLNEDKREMFYERLRVFTQQVWRNPSRRQHRWDMAILYNPDEATAPSDAEAIKRFVKAASKVGIEAEILRSDQLKYVSQYDALFIRETTSIDHPTYRLSRKAEIEGLVVIDDATSIMRCCNKIFLHDAFSYNGVHAPSTLLVSNNKSKELDRIEAKFSYPVVLKMPESSFSIGVYKVANREELKDKLALMFKESALALVQEYLYTDYDWRIGVLNGRAIYACKYFMARDHWQIYNHASSRKSGKSGSFETIPTFEAPRAVIDAALKASAIIGNGLYGVDIKQKGKQIYVIEVNDNPSIEHEVEDAYLGDELYMMIMQEFVDRLERRGRS
ncbi:MAG: RimK family protein [Opitutales bacterium]|jgi:glutathione synthase/RimK-type ligase-like ATP-grasp enzyme|nr:RimK family protein [Opitutales bacterium]MDP4644340.1 RimK family protein [Opitutales bacterium]MDP4693971.1 RimK family protein [Opitutales bacterium]MDP4777112.1 RimK family protein [Opitutales bacterium]MDP4884772.1 RimK family protein [Opitutales bacterium]